MKHCSNENCKQSNPQDYTSFSLSRRAKDGLQSICKACQASKTRDWYSNNKEYVAIKRKDRWEKSDKRKESLKVLKWQQANPDKLRSYNLKRKFNITIEQYNELFNNQNGLCKICNKPETAIDKKNSKLRDLAVDHCHKTKRVRGLLCTRCNIGLGAFEDNTKSLEVAIQYLKEQEDAN